MFGFLDKLLSKLPGNGSKTTVGTALIALPLAWPELLLAYKAGVAAFGGFVTAVGLFHKAVKQLKKK